MSGRVRAHISGSNVVSNHTPFSRPIKVTVYSSPKQRKTTDQYNCDEDQLWMFCTEKLGRKVLAVQQKVSAHKELCNE